MKVKNIVNGIISLLPLVTVANFGILVVNILGWMEGQPGGLDGNEFKHTFWVGVWCAIIPIIWYSLGGIVLKKNPFKIWKSWVTWTLSRFSDIMLSNENN